MSHPISSGARRTYTYNVRLIRRDLSYSVREIADLFRLHPNAVRRWVNAGLQTIDGGRPQLIHGSHLVDFLDQRQRGRKRRCGPDEMYCCRCRAPRRPKEGRVAVDRVNTRQLMIRGECELCGARMNRGGSLDRLSDVEREFTVTAAPPSLSETANPAVMCHSPHGV